MKITKAQLIKFINEAVIKELAEANPPPVPGQQQTQPAAPQQPPQAPPAQPAVPQETGNLATDSMAILQANKDKLAKKGINVDQLKQLGVGTMGVAYDLGDRVLKVTKDKKEAQASAIVAGKNIPNIVQVYDIWKFPGVNWYGLIIEKLTPVSKEEEEKLKQVVLVNTASPKYGNGFPQMLHVSGDDWNAAMKLLAQEMTQKAQKQAYAKFPDADPAKGGKGMQDPRVTDFVRTEASKTIQGFDLLTKEYKMRQLFKSLKSLGVRYYDFHGGNYGRRPDGTLVLFDLGRSISQGAQPQELTERTIKLLESAFGPGRPIRVLR